MKGRILILQDVQNPQSTLGAISTMLAGAGHDVATAADLPDCLSQMSARTFDLLVTPDHTPGTSPADLLRQVRQISEEIQILVICDSASILSAIESFQRSAFSFLPNPI